MSLKIAIVGTGGVATHSYLPYLMTVPDIELGLYNRTPEKAEQAAQKFGAQWFSSLPALVAWQPTTILVLTSERVRYEVGNELLDLRVPRLFFEKPLVAALGQADVTEEDFLNGQKLLKRAQEQGCETAMVFNYRFFEQSLRAKKLVAERQFGKVINVVGLAHFACLSHVIDLIHHFCGDLNEITALSRDDAPSSDVVAAFRLKNGATGTFVGTGGLQWQHPLYELIISFENGRIHMRDLDGTLEILDGATQTHEMYSLVRHNSRWDQYNDSFKKSLDAYLDSLRNGTNPPVPGIDGLRELQFEAALKRSIRQKRPVTVQQEFLL